LAASTKYHDKNTPCTFEAEVGGLQGGITGVFLQIVFTDWVLSSRHLSGDHAVKTEHIELVFGSVTLNYKPVVNGMLGSNVPMAYDISKQAVSA
jgi:type VI protein secretion system component Hcp